MCFFCLNALIYNLIVQFIKKKPFIFNGFEKKSVSNSFEHLTVFFLELYCIFSMVNESNCTCWCIQSNSSNKQTLRPTEGEEKRVDCGLRVILNKQNQEQRGYASIKAKQIRIKAGNQMRKKKHKHL